MSLFDMKVPPYLDWFHEFPRRCVQVDAGFDGLLLLNKNDFTVVAHKCYVAETERGGR